MAIGSYYRVNFDYDVGAQECTNVFHLQQFSGAMLSAQEVAEDLAPRVSNIWNPLQGETPSVSHRLVRVIEVTKAPFRDVGEYPAVRAAAGWSTNAALSPTLACIFTLRTGFAGKSARGRIYVAGAGVAESGGYVSGASTPKIDAFATALINAFGPTASSPYRLQVHSRKIFADPASTVISSMKPVTSITPQKVLGNMRSRRPGVGN